jgi:hypothetical protein
MCEAKAKKKQERQKTPQQTRRQEKGATKTCFRALDLDLLKNRRHAVIP